jgi:hypothetical protein
MNAALQFVLDEIRGVWRFRWTAMLAAWVVWMTGALARSQGALGLMLALVVAPAFAQFGPITSQSLFFDQASNAHHGNYLEAAAGAVYTDNVNLQRGSPGGTLAMLGLVGDTSRQGTRLDYRLGSDISLVKYLHSEFKTQPFGYLDGAAELRLVPGLFSWTARETYSQATLTATGPTTPDTLEAINYVTTGPRFTLRPTLRTTLIVDGTYSYVDSSSKSPLYVNIDNHRYGGDITLSRAFTNTSSAYVTGSSEKVEFTDQAANSNFRQDQALAGFRFAEARTIVNLMGGYVKVHDIGHTEGSAGVVPGSQSQTPGGTTWRIDLSRLISPTQRVSLHANEQVTDAAGVFRLNIDQPVPTAVLNRIVGGQPFTDREYGATWRLEANRTTLELDLVDVSQRYRATPIDNSDAKDVSVLFGRQLSPVLNWDIGATYVHADYAVAGAQDTVNAISSVRWRIGRRFGLRFIYAHSTQSPHGYTQNQVGISASYALIPEREAGWQSGEAPVLQPNAPMSSQRPPLR